MIFATIGNLVSVSLAQFRFRRTREGVNWPVHPNEKTCPFSAARESRAVKPLGAAAIVSLAALARQALTHSGGINLRRDDLLGQPSSSLVSRQVRRSSDYRMAPSVM
jgi:hypothetical protein